MSFKEEVMDKKNYATILNLPATGAIVQAVGQTKRMWLLGLAYETKEIKQFSYDQGKLIEFCRYAKIKYPISRHCSICLISK
jgi:phosphate transport system substrate-binding protein